MFQWAYRGVNSSIPGNGGFECASFLSSTTKLIESVIVLTLAAVLVTWGYNNISSLQSVHNKWHEQQGRKILLVLTTLIWGIEIGFKLASESVIYLLNPCHVTTTMQIYLLAAPPSKTVTAMFRIHLNFLNGAVLAILFPVTDARVLPFETMTYWTQHIMMLVVPYYLLRLGGVYNLERLADMSWWAFSYGSNIIYHYVVLQGLAIPTQVNLNHMLCPAELDPFHGPYYRCLGVAHQSLLSPITNKFYALINHFNPTTQTKDGHASKEIQDVRDEGERGHNYIHQTVVNGHLHRE